jgi:hypothetical protein
MNEKNSLLLVLWLTLATVAMLLVAAPLVSEMAYARAAAGQGGRAITTVRCSATSCIASSTATGPTGGVGGNGGGPGGGSGGAGGTGTSTGVVSPPPVVTPPPPPPPPCEVRACQPPPCELRACQPPPVVTPPPVIPPTRGGGDLGSGGLDR